MITKDQYEEAERIVLAYHRQILTVIGSVRYENSKPVKPVKSLEDVEEGDSVECIFVHSASTKHLTKGACYTVIKVEEDYRFTIVVDSGKKKSYYLTNQHFKVV